MCTHTKHRVEHSVRRFWFQSTELRLHCIPMLILHVHPSIRHVIFYCIKWSFSMDYKSSIKYSNYLGRREKIWSVRVMNGICNRVWKVAHHRSCSYLLRLRLIEEPNQTNWLYEYLFHIDKVTNTLGEREKKDNQKQVIERKNCVIN